MGRNDFDHIINEKLSNASAVPPPHILENLKFDRNAKQKMVNAEVVPPPHIWKKIAASVLPEKKVFFTRARVAAVAVLLLSFISILIFVTKKDSNLADSIPNTENYFNTPEATSKNITKKSDSNQNTGSSPQDVISKIQENKAIREDASKSTQEYSLSDLNPQSSSERDNQDVAETVNQAEVIFDQSTLASTQSSNPNQEETPSLSVNNATNDNNSSFVDEEALSLVEVDSRMAKELESTIEDINFKGIEEERGNPIRGSIKPNPRNIQQFSISLKYAPDVMTVNTQQFYRHGLDLGFNYQNRNLIVETGVGGQYTNSNAEYTFSYLDYDHYVGTYDSIAAGGPISDTSFHASSTHIVNIYDTVQLSYTERAYEHYANIRIPLMVGYQKDFRDYSVFVKGGVMYNLNIYQQSTNINEPGNISELIEFAYPNMQLYKSQIEYMLAVGGNMDLTRNMKLSGELLGRMSHFGYFRNQRNKAFGLGIRVGFVYEW